MLFSRPERPHGDELTFFQAAVAGDGLSAATAVESIHGDDLAGFLRDLGQAPQAWNGERQWQTIARELSASAACDSHGHVTLAVTVRPRPWEPTWWATVTLEYDLGDLIQVASEVEAWFR